MTRRSRKILGWTVAAVFLTALFLGAGPGILLVNRPEMVAVTRELRLPYLYAWGILWYVVEALCVVFACLYFWRDPDEDYGDA
ncbi:MAG: hypothetical protein O7J95_16900 [Planctomycetota bacterium]|nr:hypothetical protein [Planctomycetota bacterium]